MAKHIRFFILVILPIVSLLLLNGCTDSKTDNDVISNQPPQETNVATENDIAEDDEQETSDKPQTNAEKYKDFFDILQEKDKEFYVICGRIYHDTETGAHVRGNFPEMEYGQGARIVADVDIFLSPGTNIADYIEVMELKSFDLMSISEIADIVNPPEVADAGDYNDVDFFPYSYNGLYFLRYSENEDVYYILLDNVFYDVFKNGEKFLCYTNPILSRFSDPLSPFRCSISLGYLGTGTTLTPCLTDEQIMNFTDDEIMFLGALDGKKKLNGLPSPLFNRGDRHFEEGYKYCGIAADRPASDYEEALRIAEENWTITDDEDFNYGQIYLLKETEEYWFFQRAVGGYTGAYSTENLVVYKNDYYDKKEEWPSFELTEEFINNFLALQDLEYDWGVCIGKYYIEDDSGITFRQYYINSYAEMEVNPRDVEYAYLGIDEWYFFKNGEVKFVNNDAFYRKVYMPSFSIY